MNSENIKRILFFYILITVSQSIGIFELFIRTPYDKYLQLPSFFVFMRNETQDMLDKNLNTSFCSGMEMHFIFPLGKMFARVNSLHCKEEVRMSVYVFFRNISLQNFVGSLSCFSVRVILASRKELGRVPSFLILCNNFRNFSFSLNTWWNSTLNLSGLKAQFLVSMFLITASTSIYLMSLFKLFLSS